MNRRTTCIRLSASAVPLLAALGCYLSHADLEDAGPDDAGRDDAVRDDARDVPADMPSDVPPGEWAFVDDDIPDRALAVRLYFAEVPAVAWNGTVAGVVYHGLELGSDDRIGFLALDALGNPVGDECVLAEGRGLNSAMPRIAVSNDGDFLVSFVDEGSDRRLRLLRVDSSGDILANGDWIEDSDIADPLPAPADGPTMIDVATTSWSTGEERPWIYNYDRASLWPMLASSPDFFPGGFASAPQMTRAPGGGYPLLAYHTPRGTLRIEQYQEGGTFPGPISAELTFGAEPSDYGIASSSTDWFVFAFEFLGPGAPNRLSSIVSGGSPVVDELYGELYGIGMGAAASDHPAWGAALALWDGDGWGIHAILSARVPGRAEPVHAALEVSDPAETRRMDDIPQVGLAWTDGGFLVVWDEWREGPNYALFSSFVALRPVSH